MGGVLWGTQVVGWVGFGYRHCEGRRPVVIEIFLLDCRASGDARNDGSGVGM